MPDDDDGICYFFDQLAIREGAQVIYTKSNRLVTFKNIFVHTFATDDKLLSENEGNTELWFYLASQEDAKPRDKYIKAELRQSITVNAEEPGDLANH